VKVIIANGPPVLHVARSATRTIPIVAIDLETDPVASGVAASLARPGGNITGVFFDFPNFTAKWIEMLVENNPKLSRTSVLWDPITGPVQMKSVKKAAGSLNMQLDILEVRRPSDFEAAFLIAGQRGADAMVSRARGRARAIRRRSAQTPRPNCRAPADGTAASADTTGSPRDRAASANPAHA